MTINITYPSRGRGAWSGNALNLKGTAEGPYFRAPASGVAADRLGYKAAVAARSTKVVDISINDYAIYKAVIAIQAELRRKGFQTDVDGIWGPATDGMIKEWQDSIGIRADGIYGQQTAHSMWSPVIDEEVAKRNVFFPHLDLIIEPIMKATCTLESNWDIAAVGVTTPQDTGLCQINLTSHPDFSVDKGLNPRMAIRKQFDIIKENLDFSGWVVDDAIACYNVGRGGAQAWINAGRPADSTAGRYVQLVRSKME